VLALPSIQAAVTQQQQLDGVLLFLEHNYQHISSLHLKSVGPQNLIVQQLPQNLQLTSLHLAGTDISPDSYPHEYNLRVQLQPGNGFRGVLGSAAAGLAALKQLELRDFELQDCSNLAYLAAALSQLPAELEHLAFSVVGNSILGRSAYFPTGVLQRLQQLTYVELSRVGLYGPDQHSPALQPLQALTRLVDLRVNAWDSGSRVRQVTASMLSGTQHLTCLQLSNCDIHPGVLAGKTLLQHLDLARPRYTQDAAAHSRLAQLLSHLQPLQQLTHLSFTDVTWASAEHTNPPAAAYSALTASSKLQHLSMYGCTMLQGLWQHVFPTGRQLPHLRI
jgi:hypothetical protein